MNLEFRLAVPSDLDNLLTLMQMYYIYDGHDFQETKASYALSQLLSNPAFGLAWLIEADGELAGYIVICFGYSLEFGGRDCFIDELFLHEPYRGKGIGGQAIEYVVMQCREQGVQAVHLEVMPGNRKAIDFYKRVGFIERGGTMMSRYTR
ncbi:MAG: GNAT family N-acetyltransferase [Anaerolineae bacterium]|nr:GNAT family N-acetyltransferase [Anaerolineae bacterium]